MTNFCAPAVKKLIIKEAVHFDEGAIFMTLRVLTNALCGALLTVIFAIPAHAQSQNVKNITYSYHQSGIFSLSYDIARSAMKGLYKNYPDTNPIIAIAETDLNGDSYPEIIAFPMEDEEFESGIFCKPDNLCPHYIIQVREKDVHVLGIIYTSSLDVSDTSVRGYWTLRAYNKEAHAVSDYDVYAFDPDKDEYDFANTVTGEAMKPQRQRRGTKVDDKKEDKEP